MGLLDRFRRTSSDPRAEGGDDFAWASITVENPSQTPGQEIDSLKDEVRRLKEDLSGGISYDPDMYLSPQGGGTLFFNRLSQGQRELNPVQQERALELSYFLYESNPLGKSIVETTRDFVLGDSVGCQSTDADEKRRKEQQEVVDDLWSDPINLMDLKIPSKVLELGLWGEQCYPIDVNPVDGSMRLGYIDPGAINSVFLNPRNVEQALAVITTIRSDTGYDTRWWKIAQPNDDPNSQWYGRIMVDKEPVTWIDAEGVSHSHEVEGTCFYFAVNKVSNAGRGRSDLLCLIDWIDAYDQLLFGEVDRGLLMKAFIWDVQLEGYTDNQITAYQKANPQPRAGSVRYHNEKVQWQAVTPDLKVADASAASDLILSYVSTGARLPKTWLNGTMDVNKATAQELGAPALARLALRQQIVKHMITQIVTCALDQAEMKGLIKKRAKRSGKLRPAAWGLQLSLPDLKNVNQIAAAQAFNNVVVGAATAVMEGFIDLQLAQDLVVMLVKQMGIDVNITDLRARLEANPPPMAADQVQQRPRALNSPPATTAGSKAPPSSQQDVGRLVKGMTNP